MKKIEPILFICLLFFTGCKSDEKKPADLSNLFTYNSKTKQITIDFNKIKNYQINSIEIKTTKNLKQTLFLDSLKQIEHLENSIKVLDKGYLNNTWYNFDKQTNLNVDLSYYYDTYILSSKGEDSSYVVYEALFDLYGGNHYAVLGEYDEFFNLKNKNKVDTFWMKKDEPIIMIPLNEKTTKRGWQNIKFVVYEDKIKGKTITRKRTFVDRDYFIESEK